MPNLHAKNAPPIGDTVSKGIWHWTLVGIKTGFIEMRSHPMRSILSAMGVMIGIAVMVVMLSLAGGVERLLKERIGKWMGNVNVWTNDEVTPENKRTYSRSPGLRFSDGVAIEQEVAGMNRFFRLIQRNADILTVAGQKHAHVRGVDSATLAQDFNSDIPLEIKEGLTFSDIDYRNGTDVCLLSTAYADEIREEAFLPDSQSMLGMGIGIQNRRYRIIGLYGSIRPGMGKQMWWRRNTVYIPLLSAQENLAGFNPDPGYLWLQVKDPSEMEQTLQRILATLLAKHRGVEDFEYQKPDFLNTFINMIENINTMFLIVALVALIAGGLGIMNVMLSSVSERVREIGVRKALGAGEIQIFVQFVAESSTLCFIGGIFGALLGSIPMLFADVIEQASGLLPTLLPSHGVAIFLIIVLMGVAFGTYPALKAARMNPIDALRYE